ncbi:hypothetical protein QBC39DRAFT_402317, partial [Podospora conica]
MAQGPASAASSEQPKRCAIGPQLSRHALRRRASSLVAGGTTAASVGQGGSWPLKLPAGRCLACPTATSQRCGRLGMAAEEVVVVVVLHKYRHPSTWRIPWAPYPWRRSPQLPSSQFLRMRSVAQQHRPGSVIKRPGSGDKMFGGKWPIACAQRNGPRPTGQESKARNRRSAWEGPWRTSDTELRPRGPASPSSTADGETLASLAITSCRHGHGHGVAEGCVDAKPVQPDVAVAVAAGLAGGPVRPPAPGNPG